MYIVSFTACTSYLVADHHESYDDAEQQTAPQRKELEPPRPVDDGSQPKPGEEQPQRTEEAGRPRDLLVQGVDAAPRTRARPCVSASSSSFPCVTQSGITTFSHFL